MKEQESIVRGTKARVVTKGKETHLPRPVKTLYPLEIRGKGEGCSDVDNSLQGFDNSTRTVLQRKVALSSWWQLRFCLTHR